VVLFLADTIMTSRWPTLRGFRSFGTTEDGAQAANLAPRAHFRGIDLDLRITRSYLFRVTQLFDNRKSRALKILRVTSLNPKIWRDFPAKLVQAKYRVVGGGYPNSRSGVFRHTARHPAS
jgi:hypothetical protein